MDGIFNGILSAQRFLPGELAGRATGLILSLGVLSLIGALRLS